MLVFTRKRLSLTRFQTPLTTLCNAIKSIRKHNAHTSKQTHSHKVTAANLFTGKKPHQGLLSARRIEKRTNHQMDISNTFPFQRFSNLQSGCVYSELATAQSHVCFCSRIFYKYINVWMVIFTSLLKQRHVWCQGFGRGSSVQSIDIWETGASQMLWCVFGLRASVSAREGNFGGGV